MFTKKADFLLGGFSYTVLFGINTIMFGQKVMFAKVS